MFIKYKVTRGITYTLKESWQPYRYVLKRFRKIVKKAMALGKQPEIFSI